MLSKIVKNITPSATCQLEGDVAAMKAAGIDVVALNIGEPDYGTPIIIKDACKEALYAGKTTYVDTAGIPELRNAICEKLKKDNDVIYDPKQICVSTGAKQALYNAVFSVTNPGDEVIIPTPSWVSYVEIVKMIGGTPVCVNTLPDNQLDLSAIAAAITEKTAAIIVNSPNNPTGAVYSRTSLETLVDLAIQHDFMIISDEIYEKLIYGNAQHVCIASISPAAYEHCIVINGLSKAYRMTGWRIGYSAAPAPYADGIKSIQGHVTSNSTTFVQWAAIEALRNGDASIQKMVEEFARRKEYAFKRLSAMKNVHCSDPEGAFYLLPDVSAYYGKRDEDYIIQNSFDMCDYILREYKVALVPGGAFLSPNTVRVAYTNSMNYIKEGLDRIECALARLH